MSRRVLIHWDISPGPDVFKGSSSQCSHCLGFYRLRFQIIKFRGIKFKAGYKLSYLDYFEEVTGHHADAKGESHSWETEVGTGGSEHQKERVQGDENASFFEAMLFLLHQG